MELTLNNNFEEITNNELELIDGGGWQAAGVALIGTIGIAGGVVMWAIPGWQLAGTACVLSGAGFLGTYYWG